MEFKTHTHTARMLTNKSHDIYMSHMGVRGLAFCDVACSLEQICTVIQKGTTPHLSISVDSQAEKYWPSLFLP